MGLHYQSQQEVHMKEKILTVPQIILIAGTRVALGAGIGLLLADKIDEKKRQGAGWALFAVGVLTTIPLLMGIHGKSDRTGRDNEAPEALIKFRAA
jgi:cyanate permease